jgi:putative ABC transport system permease protein
VMAMVSGLASSISEAGSPDNLIVLRKGATTETYSNMTLDQFDTLKFLQGVRRDSNGDPDASPELPVQVLLESIQGGRDNIVIRGVLPVALRVHDKLHIIEGRMFQPSMREVIVGKGLRNSYRNCTVGSTIHFGRGDWKVVGMFDAAGSSFESEIWADIHDVQADSQRGAYYAIARLKLLPGADEEALIRRIADDPRINLTAESEPQYYKDQSVVANQLRMLGMVVAVVMGIGAVFAAMNTMYASVSARTAEIGTLRALGFSPGAVMGSFLIESLMLATLAGLLGIIIALPIDGFSTTFGNFLTFSTLSFNFRVTPSIMIQALAFAAIMGAFGGWLPARQAMRLSVVNALRRI